MTGSLRAPSASIPSSGHSVILLPCSLFYRFSNHCPKKSWGGRCGGCKRACEILVDFIVQDEDTVDRRVVIKVAVTWLSGHEFLERYAQFLTHISQPPGACIDSTPIECNQERIRPRVPDTTGRVDLCPEVLCRQGNLAGCNHRLCQ